MQEQVKYLPDLEAAEGLRKARALIEKGWTQGLYYDTKYEGFLNKHLKRRPSHSYCALGAVGTAVPLASLRGRMEGFLEIAVDYAPIMSFNDHPNRTKEQVLAAFDRAITYATEGIVQPYTYRSYRSRLLIHTIIQPEKIDVTKEVREFVNSLMEPEEEPIIPDSIFA